MIPFSRMILLAATFVAVLAMLGCDDPRRAIVNKMNQKTAERNAKLEQTVRTALASGTNHEVLLWQEFKANWPQDWQALGFAWHEDQQEFKGAADATSLVEGRYVLKIVVDFEVTRD